MAWKTMRDAYQYARYLAARERKPVYMFRVGFTWNVTKKRPVRGRFTNQRHFCEVMTDGKWQWYEVVAWGDQPVDWPTKR